MDARPDARRTVALLVAATALGGAASPVLVSLGGLVGQALASRPALATLPVSLYTAGLALSTIPAALLARRFGRRRAYVLGALLGIAGALLAAGAIAARDFATFCAAAVLLGYPAACVQSYRFAAMDAVGPAARPAAVSRVMLGGLLAAVIGPQLVFWTRDVGPATPFAASFLAQALLPALALPLLLRLRAGSPAAEAAAAAEGGPPRPLGAIVCQPRCAAALLAGVLSYGLMSFVMTASPIAMVGCGHGVGAAALGIQWHVLAMFAPAFATPVLMRRIGKVATTALGLLLIGAAGGVALAGLSLAHFWGALVLLGVGWNFGFTGATALVADCWRPSERQAVQAFNDFTVFGTVALASFASGSLLSVAGWARINQALLPLAAVGAVVLVAVHALTPAGTPAGTPTNGGSARG